MFRGFFIYAISSLVLRAATAFVSLVLIHFLTVAEFGLLSLINSLLAIVPLLLQFGLRQAFWVEYFHAGDRWPVLLNRVVLMYTFLALPLLVVLAFLLPHACACFCGVCLAPLVVTLILVYSFVHFFSELFLALLRCQMRAGLLALVQLGAAALLIAVNFVLVAYAHLGAVGWLCANVSCVSGICVCAIIFYLLSGIGKAWDVAGWWPQTWALVRLGLPFIPNIACAWLASAGLRWLLAGTADLAAVGIYGLVDVANQAFNLCILYPLSASYVPYILGQFAQADDVRVVERRNRQFMVLAMGGTLLVGLIGIACAHALAPVLLPPAYRQAVIYLPPIVIANVLLVGTYFLSAYLIYRKHVWPLVFAHGLWALATILFGLFLIPRYSVWGAVITSVCASSVFFACNCVINRAELRR